MKSKLATLLLCLVFGVYGAHRFYVGKISSGILYLCTAGLFGIGIIIDLFDIILISLPIKMEMLYLMI